MKVVLLASACAAALVSTSMTAQAQTASPDAKDKGQSEGTLLNEVVVTATRRNERLQDVPLSITAFSQKDLTAKGIVGYEGLARETPGVVLNKPTANFNNFTARGIATNGYGANLQSTVAIYIDELPISTIGNTTVLDPNLYDLERVEFLRGPQGTLFGSGSLSGALRILTKSPDLDEVDASALVDFGLTGSDSLRQRYNGMVNLPIIKDQLALRVVGFYRHEEGYVDNLGTGVHNSNTLVDGGGRATLLWKPTDRLSVKLLGSYEKSNPKDSSLIIPSLGRNKRVSDRPDLFVGKLASVNATVDYQFDGAHFTSSSTYSKFDQKFFVDLAGTFGAAGIAFGLDAYGYQKTFVEEARLASDPGGKFDWVVGGFYLDRRLDVDYFYRSSPEYLAAHHITGLPDEYYQRQYTHINSHELAGFGELTYHINDKLWLTTGMRYGGTDAQGFTEGGYNSAYLTYAIFGIQGPLTMVPIPAATGVKAEAKKPSYKVSLSYKPSSSLTSYATVSTGFRTPVVNAFAGRASVVDPTDLIIPYGASSDDLVNYELGVKGRWFDGTLSANLATYLIDWSNIQVQANRVSDSVQFATNIGGAISKGVEFEVVVAPATGLSVGLNGSFNDAKVNKLTPAEAAISGAVENARLAAPHFQGSMYINYGFDLSPQARANASVVFQHVGSYPGSFPNVPGKPTQVSPTYGFTDAYENVNATFAVAMDRLTVGAYVENLFDNHSITYVHPEAFLAARYATLRPRTVGVRLGYDF
ncbi:TonB-dependent receptor [Caulobacter sp. Root1455]|uniref:TonB-dependent receptor n=1 Tax=Caulobacter sp. Root1455 TaxID=1736465 RepID=UPI0006F68D6A|nr:TonB-dependent receptor [Caulobacter sp. Root1455]KQZ04742.1 TonB-dependent receptor [Caulobacter sp. Root1455]